MKVWTIRKRLTIGFGSILAIMTAVGGYLGIRLTAIETAADVIAHSALPAIESMTRIETFVRQNMLFLSRHVYSDDPGKMAEIERQMKALTATIEPAYLQYERTIRRPRDRALFEALAPARKEYLALRRELLEISRRKSSNREESLHFYQTRMLPAMDRYIERLHEIVEENHAQARANSQRITEVIASARRAILAGVGLTMLAGLVLASYIVASVSTLLRASISRLTEGAGHVSGAATEVAGSAQSLSRDTSEQAASLQQTSTSMSEIAAMTQRTADDSQSAAATMEQTGQLVRRAHGALAEMVASMEALRASSQSVSGIIRTIDDIAFQTNILALNAAVEAARAGQAGTGFAVVADEVRTLAQKTAHAARDTADLIEASIASSARGHQHVAEVRDVIEAIAASASTVKRLIEEVSAAGRLQQQGIDKVSHAVMRMERVTQTTAASAQQSAAAGQELSVQAEAVRGIIDDIAMLVGANGSR